MKLFVGVIVFFAVSAYGGVEFAEKEPQDAGVGGQESRFGFTPAAPPFGIRPGYASRAVTAMEGDDEALDARTPVGGRAPASVTMAKAHGAPQAMAAAPEFETATARRGVQEVALIAGDLGFFPKVFFVAPEVPVRLFVTASSKNTLCFMMDSFQVKKQVKTAKVEEITFTPSAPGSYRFYCPVNGMEGTMVVKEIASREE